MALSVKEIEHAKPVDRDRKLYDEKGLYLLIAMSGSRRWYLKYRFLGAEKKLGLGHYPQVSLKAARAKRAYSPPDRSLRRDFPVQRLFFPRVHCFPFLEFYG